MSNSLKTALILGSGVNVGAGAKIKNHEPPMDHNFFKAQTTQEFFTQEKYPALSWYQKEPSLEKTMSTIDLYGKLCLGGVISEEEAYYQCKKKMEEHAQSDISYGTKMIRETPLWRLPSMAGWELGILITEVFKNIEPPSEDENKLKKLLITLKEKNLLHAIITFNYDLFLEKTIQQEDSLKEIFEYAIPSKHEDKSKIQIYKLHGSLNWEQSQKGVEVEYKDLTNLNIPERKYYPDGKYTQPTIIGPTLFKQEIAVDFQKEPVALFFKSLWRMCWEKLKEMDNLIFIGFSFPQTDFHVRALFESIYRVRTFKKVVVCTKEERKEDKEKEKKEDKQSLKGKFEKIFTNVELKFYKEGFENLNIQEIIQFLLRDHINIGS